MEEEKMLTLEKFEEASEVVRRVTLETKLVYSDYFSQQTGAKVFFKPVSPPLRATMRRALLMLQSVMARKLQL